MFITSKRWTVFLLSLFVLCLTAQAASCGRRSQATTTTAPAKKNQPTRSVPKNAAPVAPSASSRQQRNEAAERIEQERLEQERQEAAQRVEQERLARERQEAAERAEQQHNAAIIQNLLSNMVYVQGGTFMMEATSEQVSEAYSDEEPTHQVTLSGFYIGKYEVTQREWEAVMGSNPSSKKRDNTAVTYVSWDDCQIFIAKLNSLTGKNFRLPTEAEWEYAARGGNKSRGFKYSGSNNLDEVAWYDGNSRGSIHDVGTKQPNELGLYDMSGNVREWCQDWFGEYSDLSQTNPTGPVSGSVRVLRGGGWGDNARYCRSSSRGNGSPSDRNYDCGLRLVCSE